MEDVRPAMSSVVRAHGEGLLRRRAAEAFERLSACDLCPRGCGVDRIAGEVGECATGRRARVASFGPHFGEEDPLAGRHGSGTVFFAGCNLNCVFCQNHDISQGAGAGRELDATALARVFLAVQEQGCHNLNLVTPTHVLAPILEALDVACTVGFRLPLVWNCGGYESPAALGLLDGIVDVYMPDLKFADAAPAEEFCRAPDYPETARRALREMHRQVGALELDGDGIARRGLLVRHLVLPNGRAGTDAAARFLASLSPRTYLNVMGQYRPAHRACDHPSIARRPRPDELERAREAARAAGLVRLDDATAARTAGSSSRLPRGAGRRERSSVRRRRSRRRPGCSRRRQGGGRAVSRVGDSVRGRRARRGATRRRSGPSGRPARPAR